MKICVPVAIPLKNLAAYIISTPLAKIIKAQLIRKGITRERIEIFLPTASANIPTGIAKISAPMGRNELTHDPEIIKVFF